MSASPELILIMVGMMLNFPAWKKKGEVTPERTTTKQTQGCGAALGKLLLPLGVFVPRHNHGGFAGNSPGG